MKNQMNKKRGWYGFDLDATLAHYSGWKGEEHIGEIIPRMAAQLLRHIAEGHECRIVTARVSPKLHTPADAQRIRLLIQDYTEANFGIRLLVQADKDYDLIALYDDRCVQVQANTGRRLDGEDVPPCDFCAHGATLHNPCQSCSSLVNWPEYKPKKVGE